MNILVKYFVLLKLVTELCSVNAYTVFLKPVLPLYPSIRVYKYDVRHPKIFKEPAPQYIQHTPVPVQRIYPVYVKHQHNQNFRTVFPIKKEKIRYKIKISPTTEKLIPREHRLHDLQQELVPPQSNQLEDHTESKEELTEVPDGDVSLTVPEFFNGERFPSFGQESGRLYSRPGEWAVREPSTESDNSTESNFTPSQLYLQVRHKNTVIHVPQSEALKDAETLEELINAPRLKELARVTHVQEMYSEEGYEDAGYDHAGHIRHAQHGEVYDAKDEGKFNIKDAPKILDYDSDREESENMHNPKFTTYENVSAAKNLYEKTEQNKVPLKTDDGNTSALVKNPASTFYKKERIYSSSDKQPLKIDTFIQNTYINSTDDKSKDPPSTTPIYLIKRFQVSTENTSIKAPNNYLKPPLPKNFSSNYRQSDVNSTRIYKIPNAKTSNITDFELPIDSQSSPSAKSLKYSRIYSKKTKHLRLEPFKTGTIYKPFLYSSTHLSVPVDKPIIEGDVNQRIVLPTIGYINSLTTAHFGKGNSTPPTNESKAHLTKPLNLTQALNYLRSNKKEKPENKFENFKKKSTESSREADITIFEPKRLKISKLNTKNHGKTKREVFLMEQQKNITKNEDYEEYDETDLPHSEKNKEIEEDERKRIEEENIEKDKYEKDLKDTITDVEKEVLKETNTNFGLEDMSEIFSKLPSSSLKDEEFESFDLNSKKKIINKTKYPFYFSKSLPENSALRYMSSPFEFPKKSGQGMEFYESREKLIQCPEFQPPLDEVPAPGSEPQRGQSPRLINLGDKIACLRAKYFDLDPFDSPFFKETDIEYVGKPKKLKKALLPNTSKVKSKFGSPQTMQKEAENLKLQSNSKIINIPHLDVSNSQTKHSEEKRTELNKQKEGVSIPSSYIYLKNNTQEENKKLISDGVNPSIEAANKSFLHNLSSSIYRIPHTNFFTAPQVNSVKNLQPYKNVETIFPHNCVPVAQRGTKNIVLDCSNFNLFHTGSSKSEIIPALQLDIKNITTENYGYQTDWVPKLGYNLIKNGNNSIFANKPVGRKEDDVSNRTNNSKSNIIVQNVDSDHFVLDELVEDEKLRKGEVLDDMDHYYKLLNETKLKVPEIKESQEEVLKTTNNTREKREAGFDAISFQSSTRQSDPVNSAKETQTDLSGVSNPFEITRPFTTKKTLTRLSGKDFLNRYHSKNRRKNLSNSDSSNFWKISTSPNPKNESNIHKKKEEYNERKEKQSNNKGKEIIEYNNFKIDKKIQETQKIFPKSSEKKTRKLETKQTTEFRKTPFLNLVPEKITKKEKSKSSVENDKIGGNPVKTNSSNESKIVITKIVSAISETTEKYKTIRRKNEETTTKSPSNDESIERRKNSTKMSNSETSKKNGKERTSQYIEVSYEPVLYYVVDERTGRGKWISSRGKRRKLFQNSDKRSGNHKTLSIK